MEAETPRRTSLLLWCFFWGCVFEGLLILAIWLFRENPVLVHLYNFALFTHIPLFWISDALNIGDITAVLVLILAAFLWAAILYGAFDILNRIKERFFTTQKRKLLFKVGAVAVFLPVMASVIISSWPAKAMPFTSTPELETVVENNTAFALDLYQQLKSRPGNLFFSPYSISTSLAMTSAGARGQTEMEMTNTLRLTLAPEKTHSAFGSLRNRLNQIERAHRITLKTANGIWAQKPLPFSAAFLNTAKTEYGAEIRDTDFRNAQKVSREINDWVARTTKRKIEIAVNASQISPDDKLVLCNAIYFKGTWKKQFKKRQTKSREFHLDRNTTIEVPTMYQKGEFRTAHNDEMTVEMLELPYSGEDISMVIFLPTQSYFGEKDPVVALSAMERELVRENLQAWLAKLDQASFNEVNVFLPRFTTSKDYELTEGLKSLGMISAFDGSANFSGLDGTTNLYLSKVLHRAFVNVDESGTEAAAMTYVSARAKSKSARFVVDRPFIFIIREKATGSILFFGRIVDPRN